MHGMSYLILSFYFHSFICSILTYVFLSEMGTFFSHIYVLGLH